MMDDVVITGSGMVCSLGHNKSAVWKALISGNSGIRTLRGLPGKAYEGQVGAQVERLDPAECNLHPRMARLMDLPSLMLLKCAREALAEAGLDREDIDGDDIAFYAGMEMVDYEAEHLLPALKKSQTVGGYLEHAKFYASGYREIHPLWPLTMLNNIGFCQVAIDLSIKGENAVFASHATAGIEAVVEGFWTIKEKRAKAAIVAGVSAKISPFSLARAEGAGIWNSSFHGERTTCRPFSHDRAGTVLGEGCGVLVLESRETAAARGVPILARISGYGRACEKAGKGPAPTARAIAEAAERALAYARVEPSGIDLVIAHGDGTCEGDKNEIEAIHRVFSCEAPPIKVFSSKGAVGYGLAGSTAMDVVFAVCILSNGVIPPTLNCDPVEDQVGFDIVKGQPRSSLPRRILINGRSPEGQCASLVVETGE
jgi:3-oxoacyl-[acyl-carrier-protein] synthase II